MKWKHLFLILFVLFISTNTLAQMRYYSIKGGVQYNQTLLFAEFNHYNYSFLARGYLNFNLNKIYSLEFGVGCGQLSGTDAMYNSTKTNWRTIIIPVDVKFRIAPFNYWYTHPYLYVGGGLFKYKVTQKHTTQSPDPVGNEGFSGMVFAGIGTEIKLSQSLLLDLSTGINYTFTDNLNYYSINVLKDTYGSIGIGFTFTRESCYTDRDRDGLPRCYEESIGTDPLNEDTDGDGLRDGKEVVITKTDPLKKDTDGDGLNDFEEVIIYKTNPNEPNSELHEHNNNK